LVSSQKNGTAGELFVKIGAQETRSLEDRIVKDAIREGAKNGIYTVLTKKPLTAGQEETDRNPRSRSAKMRAAERTKKVFPGVSGK